MVAENRDQGLDPFQGNCEGKRRPVNEMPLKLKQGQWYHVVLESVGDQLCLQIDGQIAIARRPGFVEKQDNFGFQAGGFDTFVSIDNGRVWQALPR